MVITEGKGVRQVEEGKRGINGDRKILWMVNTQYNIQMMYYGIGHFKPI